jgi:hypothetical protein
MKYNRIKGENRPQNMLRLPLLGKIRLGVKKVSEKSGKEYPSETDYFVCSPEIRAKYGDKPKTLPVMLPVEDEEKFLRQFYAVYGSNQKLKCIGDGETCERRHEEKREEMVCPHPENCEYGKANHCHARTIVQVVLPDINMGGVFQISTGSVNSDIDIRSGIEMARYLFGRISWVPMLLQREEKKIPDPKDGKMQTHWPVKLFPISTVEQANMIRQDNKRIIEHQKRLELPEKIIDGSQDDTPIEMIPEDLGSEVETYGQARQEKPPEDRVGQQKAGEDGSDGTLILPSENGKSRQNAEFELTGGNASEAPETGEKPTEGEPTVDYNLVVRSFIKDIKQYTKEKDLHQWWQGNWKHFKEQYPEELYEELVRAVNKQVAVIKKGKSRG